MKIDVDETTMLESVVRGEWKSVGGGKRERMRYARYAKATFRKDRRLNIRFSSKDLEAIQKRALAEGLPYQTLISSLLHKYASGRLKKTKSWTDLLRGRHRHSQFLI
jgi:predicted DNA binding CopG/RHH family protein